MKYALNQNKTLKHITESIEFETYTCPICGDYLTRKYGDKKQYFSHRIGFGDECERKLVRLTDGGELNYSEDFDSMLEKEYYEKEIEGAQIEFGDYALEEGYKATAEQEDIIFSYEDKIKISALAGSSKTSTLYYYVKERPHSKFLYIVYNKAMKDEADNTFGKLKNVEVKTMHGLAYKFIGKNYKNKLTFNYKALDVVNDLNLDRYRDKKLAFQVLEMFNEYLISDVDKISDVKKYNHLKKIERKALVNLCEKLWELKKDKKNKVKVQHDFYLKMFQLEKRDLSRYYDVILLDESQDANDLILDITKNANTKGLVMVGDVYQSLYRWRNSIDIMAKFDAVEYKLSTSFRVSPQIANVSNMVIKHMYGKEVNMKGFNAKQKIVSEIDKSKPFASLCRTNSAILERAISNIDKKFYFEGGFGGYKFNNIRDGFYFKMCGVSKNPMFNKFKNWNEITEYLTEIEDIELQSIVSSVEKYGSKIPEIIQKIEDNTVEDKSQADIIFTTIHKSKGQTYKIPMVVENDHYDMNDMRNIEEMDEKDLTAYRAELFEEMCVIYVAITRCAGEIELSPIVKQFLLNELDGY